ncbi:hypothetical protein DL93DRAFT_2090483 [Clavulina sp. PMI_390]|nr:hypothetical protein DL93DRAFT_2090483 [Clavulina sp. PMI_390]
MCTARIYADAISPAKDVNVQPFSQYFPTEIVGEFALHLPLPDLKEFALTSQSYSFEARRILWRSLSFSSERARKTTFVAFVDGLLANRERAATTRHLSLQFHENPRSRPFGSRKTIEDLADNAEVLQRVEGAFARLTRLDTCVLEGTRRLPHNLACAILNGLKNSPVAAYRGDLPMYRLLDVCESWSPTITSLTVCDAADQEGSLPDTPPFSPMPRLPRLRHIRSNNANIIIAFAEVNSLETIDQWGTWNNVQCMLSKNRLPPTIRASPQLQKVHLSCTAFIPESISRLILAMSSPSLEHIHLSLLLERSQATSLDQFLFRCLPRELSASLPALKTLKLEVVDESCLGVAWLHERDAGTSSPYSTLIATRLAEYLALEAPPSSSSLPPSYPSTLERVEVFGRTEGSWDDFVEMTVNATFMKESDLPSYAAIAGASSNTGTSASRWALSERVYEFCNKSQYSRQPFADQCRSRP